MIHPTMSRRYRSEIKALTHALVNGGAELQAREQVRGLIEKIVLTPKDTAIDLYGDLAGNLRIATEDKTMKVKGTIEKRLDNMIVNNNHNIEPSVQLVAGVATTYNLESYTNQ